MLQPTDPSAPGVGYPQTDARFAAPAFGDLSPGGALSQSQPVHSKADGYLPSWKWVAPPGIGDALQHVFSTFTLIPFSVDGPGDRPVSFLRSLVPPTVANFAMRWQGMPVNGGSVLMTGLYAPQPLESPSNDVYATGG
jgi:hypothetical protein